MKTTALKHKNYGSFDADRVYTDEDREQDRARMEDARRNDPCAGLLDALNAIDDMDSPEFLAAEKTHDDCCLKHAIQKAQAKDPNSIVVGAMDYVLFMWVHSLIEPPEDAYIPIEDRESEERMDARRFSLMLALPGHEDRDHIRLNIETRVIEKRSAAGTTYSEWLDWDKTTFTVHVGGRIIARGGISYEGDEKDTVIVNMRGIDATEELANLVLAQCTDIDPFTDWPLDLYARFARTGHCHQCNRPLTDHVSKVLQVGPTCAKGIRMEHSQRMAQLVTQRRKERLEALRKLANKA